MDLNSIVILVDEISRICDEIYNSNSNDLIQGYKNAVKLAQEFDYDAYYDETPDVGHNYNFVAEVRIPLSNGTFIDLFDVGYTAGNAGWYRQEGWLFDTDN